MVTEACCFADGSCQDLDPGECTLFRYRLVVRPGPFSAERAENAWKAFVAEYPE